MDKQYLKETQYNWDIDPKHLRIDGLLPDSRCMHCGRIFLNAQIGISFCRNCDKSMSINPLGSDHDYDSFGTRIVVKDPSKAHLPKEQQTKTINLLVQREIRSPIDFDKEHLYFDKNNKSKEEPHFITAAGRIIETEEPDPEEAERVKRLYELRKYD